MAQLDGRGAAPAPSEQGGAWQKQPQTPAAPLNFTAVSEWWNNLGDRVNSLIASALVPGPPDAPARAVGAPALGGSTGAAGGDRLQETFSRRDLAVDPGGSASGDGATDGASRATEDGRRTSKRSSGAYDADKEDLLDQHVGYYLRHHPAVHAQHTIMRKRQGVYELDGREVKVEWQYASEPGGQGFLVVVDGPLRQPLADYMEMTEQNAEYDTMSVQASSSLHSIPRDKRMSFHDQHKMYSRLEAMKVAKEQALFREKAADFVKDGREVPAGELLQKYKAF